MEIEKTKTAAERAKRRGPKDIDEINAEYQKSEENTHGD